MSPYPYEVYVHYVLVELKREVLEKIKADRQVEME